ncbi:hypothetical protein ThrDRAFT_01030 [Frankia casuarinae]|nr:hypothetical protein CcI6DRAFT_02424 [Frankia sp. CcI6]EYT93277.1 hypothetical protein ThrDRAFT_01030 [Frankia casuarinae]KDA43952.1 hypothetical protein BMG523Draft_01042 [Frankia sp. BMG5.23]OAA30378.1 hypothetical protein AAY23_100910 [Frankia casuarinae]
MGTYVVLLVMVLLVGLAVLGGLYFVLSRDHTRR